VGVPALTAPLVGAAFGVAAAGLLAATVASARPVGAPVPGRAEHARRWAALHGGYDPTGTALTGRWLAALHAVARPLARRGIAPDALTGWGLLAGLAVPAVAAAGGRWPLLAVPVLVLAGVLDGLDGAVAVLTGRATRFGSVLDSVADRVADAAFVTALWPLGAPGWLCAAGAALGWLPEYARARAGAAGMTELAVLTVFERPTRLLLTGFLLLGCGLLPGRAGAVATAGAAGWVLLGAVALAQLLVVARRRLGRAAEDESQG
jgi:CDP-diacylglycerol--glycerol-3-phosphate 3-phosphatidyltransferase